ncbi:MAG: hypothetical protein AB1349_12300 [Elusimicrobiota bacterium]
MIVKREKGKNKLDIEIYPNDLPPTKEVTDLSSLICYKGWLPETPLSQNRSSDEEKGSSPIRTPDLYSNLPPFWLTDDFTYGFIKTEKGLKMLTNWGYP